jgi:threonine dehydratase
MTAADIPSGSDIDAARSRIAPHAHHTPVATSRTIDDLVGVPVHLKCEQLQRGGAFKFRGALNAVLRLDDDVAARGVAAHSSGNHAAALALAAGLRGISAHVVMPSTSSKVKFDAVKAYGARIVECGPTVRDRAAALAEVLAETGAHEVHPYDDPDVIAGQGTACAELIEQVEGDLALVVVPVGGGGLASGSAVAAHAADPTIDVWGAEPAGADDAARSLAAGHVVTDVQPDTIADGLRASLSERTFRCLSRHLTEIVTVTDDEIVSAMRLLFERCKLVVEPSAAVGLAVVLQRRGRLPGPVGIVLTGGNVDLDALPFGGPHR